MRLVIEDDVYLVDAGRGALTQFVAAGLSPDRLKGVFVTHMHADHVVDLFSLFALTQPVAKRAAPVDVWGPGRARNDVFFGPLANPVSPDVAAAGTTDLINKSIEALSYSLNFFAAAGINDIRSLVQPHDIPLDPQVEASFKAAQAPDMAPFPIMENDKVKVSAVLVPHLFPSFAYRFDTAAGSFVFSGDTARSGNVVQLAKDADVLVHEVVDADAVLKTLNQPPTPAGRFVFNSTHTDSKEVGPLANEAGAKTLVLNHLLPGSNSAVSANFWRTNAQAGYDGKVIVGADLIVLNAAGKKLPH